LTCSELPAILEPVRAFSDVFLAVSGGADSSALMHLVAEWREGEASDLAGSASLEGTRLRFTVLTVDHGLRPEAAAEARIVASAASRLGFDAEILTWDGIVPKTAIQQRAREIRYDLLLARARRASGRAIVLMAHHKGDLAETVLMRLARGAGVDGLAAMQPMTEIEGVCVFRPLLKVPKSRLIATLEAKAATWIEDPSNENPEFERVRLRQARESRSVLGLEDDALALTAHRASRARRALESWTERELLAQLEAPLLSRVGVFRWPWQRNELEDDIAIRLLQRILPGVSGRSEPVRLDRIERLHEAMQHDGFRGATLGHCTIAPDPAKTQAPGTMLIWREPHRQTLPVMTWGISGRHIGEGSEPIVWDNRFVLTADNRRRQAVCVRAFHRDDFGALATKPTLPCPVEALESTPVVEDDTGWLMIPALDVQRFAGNLEFEPISEQKGGIVCRFRTELFRQRH